ncbi:MAG: shikimate kinase [Bacteroidetes bacterium]|nr:shikimate kinase [Bacteroidota bacterium]
MLIYLIGFSGAGKTTTGKQLASKLKFNFIDTDSFIEEKTGKSVNEIFDIDGEIRFRELEKKAIEETANYKNTVVATGGGLPCFNNVMHLMNDNGVTVYLKVNTGILFKRLLKEKKSRPLIKNLTDVEVMEFITYHIQLREGYYNQSKIKFNANEMPVKKIDELVAGIKSKIQSPA